jgi:hypothetical protein
MGGRGLCKWKAVGGGVVCRWEGGPLGLARMDGSRTTSIPVTHPHTLCFAVVAP